MNKIAPDMTLFVGGPMDGKGRRIPDYVPETLIPTTTPTDDPSSLAITNHKYVRLRLTNGMSVFMHHTLTANDVLRYLILGYRQP